MRLFSIVAVASVLLPQSLPAQNEARLVWQPVQEYFIHVRPDRKPMPVEGKKRLNSFTAYTHLGTDFGFMGPAEHDIEWQRDEICVHLGQEPEAWSGMWHSLAGLARAAGEPLNFMAAWPAIIEPRYQPRISSLRLDAHGRGRLKLEIKSETQETLWSAQVFLDEESTGVEVLAVPPMACARAKLLTWVAEPGSELCIEALFLGVEAPEVPFDEYVLAASYAKLARCYDADAGLVKDRAHLENGAFDSLASTGLFVLATAAVSAPPLGLVSPARAASILRQVHKTVGGLERPYGLLPHFVRRAASGHRIHPGTEYSTVDTAIYFHSLLLGSEMLEDHELKSELLSEVDQIDFTRLRLPGGEVSHGLKEDGRSLLPHGWKDWGGETALVMMLQNMVNENAPRRLMERPGQAWQGTGFITEIQSLFYPDFDSDKPDALDGVRWLDVRRRMINAQKEYISRTWPGSMAARMGLYGLSAGESLHGDAYHVGGADLPGQTMIHPHFILMAGSLANPAETYALLKRMEKAGFFMPWGMVETIDVKGRSYLPMVGSLNAGFETLGAYHLLARHRGFANRIHASSLQSPEMRRAVQLFYPSRRSADEPGSH
ncbi:MAG: hypothetical protein CJBNEKGG_00609 [Prosthecobacter sp.]|nr:hypothetical protein [Prosthecobacter sp.]